MGNETRFDRLFDEFTEEAFRVETLPGYNVGQDAERLTQYASGAYLPEQPIPGVSFVADLVRRGRRTTLVRLVGEPLTVDQRLSIDWVYPHHAAAGRDISILRSNAEVADLAASVGDFWLFDNAVVAVMRYLPGGEFDRADVIDADDEVAKYVALRNQYVDAATPFRSWLASWRRGLR
ncbi:DUF6879 family protein [Kribbella sp. NPDC055110]